MLENVLCSTGIAGGFIDADLSCGAKFDPKIANRYAKSDNGEFCLSAFVRFDIHGMGRRNIEGHCSDVLQSSLCPLTCRTSLETFKSKLGCCINAFVNDTVYRSGSSAVNYRVWQLCGVSLPAAGCGNALDVYTPANVDNCSRKEMFERQYTQNFCLPSRGQRLVEALLDMRCSQHAESAVRRCSVNTDGIPCRFLNFDIENLNLVCNGSNISCTLKCRESLRNITMDSGCCVNYFNRTDFGQPLSLSYDVWKSCGVETPGFCESTLSLSGALPTVKEGSVFVTFSISLMIILTLNVQYV